MSGNTHQPVKKLFKETPPDAEFHDRFDMRKAWLGVKRHAFLILFCTGLFVALSAVGTFYLWRTYETEVVLLYGDESKAKIGETYTVNRLSLPTVMEMMKRMRS